jgi:hypothetical protein
LEGNPAEDWGVTDKFSADKQELLKRYTPLADMTESEKIHASARKVGLETPIKYKRPE